MVHHGFMTWVMTALTVSAFAVVAACSSSGQVTERVAVTYLDGHREGGVGVTVKVPVSKKLATAAAAWNVSVKDAGCEGDGRTLTLSPRSNGKTVQVGEPCAWEDSAGFVSPDGQYLAAFVLGDGASAEIDLVDLGTSPVDLGIVPGSKSANYSATWTRDGRLWFTSDVDSRVRTEIFGYRPGDKSTVAMTISRAAVVMKVAARP
jgi:hypothetical protein